MKLCARAPVPRLAGQKIIEGKLTNYENIPGRAISMYRGPISLDFLKSSDFSGFGHGYVWMYGEDCSMFAALMGL
jgi:hypothetical protein